MHGCARCRNQGSRQPDPPAPGAACRGRRHTA
jgi:hypothetical protein